MKKILYNILRKARTMGKKKTISSKKCNIKCCTCEFYEKETDYCREREVENCTKQPNTDFSQCENYLVGEKFVMF